MFCFPNRGPREIWPNFYSCVDMHVNKTKLEKNTSLHTVEYYKSEEVWISETCLKAKIKASAWKTIRKTQYDNYEDYFQVFRGFSKKSYPENHMTCIEKT